SASVHFLAFLALSGCLWQSDKESSAKDSEGGPSYCTTHRLSQHMAGTTGGGLIFQIDPTAATGERNLSPGSNRLPEFTSQATLKNLMGYGILQGAYLSVLNGSCGDSYGAFHANNQFSYSYGDPRFTEVMDYHYGDHYRSELDEANALLPAQSVFVI